MGDYNRSQGVRERDRERGGGGGNKEERREMEEGVKVVRNDMIKSTNKD